MEDISGAKLGITLGPRDAAPSALRGAESSKVNGTCGIVCPPESWTSAYGSYCEVAWTSGWRFDGMKKRRQEKSALTNSSRSVVENISSGEGGSPHSLSQVGEPSDDRTGTGGA